MYRKQLMDIEEEIKINHDKLTMLKKHQQEYLKRSSADS